MTNPIRQVASELARFALNVDLLAESISGTPDPLSYEDLALLTIPVAHLRLALDRLEDALYHGDRLTQD